MRKRSSYRPRAQLESPLNYVLMGFMPISTAEDTMRTCKIKNHDALDRMIKGHANKDVVNTLINALNMSEALALVDIGHEYLDEIQAALGVVGALKTRLRMILTGPEIKTLQLAMEIHEAQIDDSRTTIGVMEAALADVKRILKQKAKHHEPTPA